MAAAEAQTQAELVFIPGAVMGHMPSMIELARKLEAQHQDGISITFLLMRFPSNDDKVESLIQSLKPNSYQSSGSSSSNDGSVCFLELPALDIPTDVDSKYFLRDFMDAYKPIIKEILLQKKHRRESQLAGIVVDMLWINMIDVANELDVHSYIFFAASAAMIRLMLHFESFGLPDTNSTPALHGTEVDEASVAAVKVAGFRNPVPLEVWPEMFFDKNGPREAETILDIARSFHKTDGILINTFDELEPNIIRSLTTERHNHSASLPPIYSVGPLIDQQKDSAIDRDQTNGEIMSWLDSQPTRSVVFLCFGSRGTFTIDQIKEIAVALEHSEHRFLWSMRRKPDENHSPIKSLADYQDFKQVLPEGFLERTSEVGKVINWAPQASVLGHRAVGAFVSHCGWNSTLEGVCSGVPILTWPMFFDQQINAYSMVKEVGLAVELRVDYRHDFKNGAANMAVGAEKIEEAIRKVMDMEGEEGRRVRKNVEEISKAGKKALQEVGGSSYDSMVRFVNDVGRNMV